MILCCPACQTRYDVPDPAIGARGRQVRCAQCRTSWFQDAPGLAGGSTADMMAAAARVLAPPPPPVAPIRSIPPVPEAPSPYGRRAADVVRFDPAPPRPQFSPFRHAAFGPRRNPARRQTWMAGAGAAAMLTAAAALAFVGPPSFDRGGTSPIQIQMQKPERRAMPGGNQMLDVSGQLINPTAEPQRVPPIRAELRDSDGQLRYSWVIAAPVPTLQPRGRISFYSAGVDIPPGENSLRVSLEQPQ